MADSKLKKEIERGSYKNCIRIKGAREHNLKGIDVDIPRDKLICRRSEKIYGITVFICKTVPGTDGKA